MMLVLGVIYWWRWSVLITCWWDHGGTMVHRVGFWDDVSCQVAPGGILPLDRYSRQVPTLGTYHNMLRTQSIYITYDRSQVEVGRQVLCRDIPLARGIPTYRTLPTYASKYLPTYLTYLEVPSQYLTLSLGLPTYLWYQVRPPPARAFGRGSWRLAFGVPARFQFQLKLVD